MRSTLADGIGWLSGGLGYALPFLFVLGIVVFFHELGHFLMARWCGIRVLVFSIGFGPELVGFNDRYNTRWKVSAIPLGGYVKFFGDESAASTPDAAALATMGEADRRQSFFYQKVGSRAAVVAAGPIANFILAIVIFAAIFTLYGKAISLAPRVGAINEGSAAAAAGFQRGDLVVAIDGRPIDNFEDMSRLVSASVDRPLEVTINRGGVRLTLKATPAAAKDEAGNTVGRLGIAASKHPDDVRREKVDPFTGLKLGVQETWGIVDKTLAFIGGLIRGNGGADQLGGPVRIAQISGEVWKMGLDNGGVGVALVWLFNLAALISVSIGLLNLFPVPLLDGGHLLFYAIEVARGRPLSDYAQEIGFRIGLALVVMLMIFATRNDFLHVFHWRG
jgi:regulator of sigma E protease